MKIALLTNAYPPASNEGIPRQRRMLADALTAQGHSVHVFSIDRNESHTQENGVHVHRVAARTGHHPQIEDGVALYRALAQVCKSSGMDIADAPIWAAPGWPVMEKKLLPVVINLQTTSAQLAAMHGDSSPELDRLIAMEKRCIQLADGILADSQVALETTIKDYGIPDATPTCCIYHGIPDSPPPPRPHRNPERIEALMVGRLEKRKGTQALFRVLPGVLQQCPDLDVRFIGGDNSEHDGWKQETGRGYAEWFQRQYPNLKDRVLFEGYVPEEILEGRRRQADFVLAPSLYESFGFVYVEAMRDALPVVALANDAAREIFQHGEADGALLAPLEDDRTLAAAILRLAGDADLRQRMGVAGRQRFLDAFQASRMAEESADFYQQVLDAKSHRDDSTHPHIVAKGPTRSHRIYQVMEALDDGDGVSQIAINNATILANSGLSTPILNRWKQPDVTAQTAPYRTVLENPDCSLIVHYWNYSRSLWLLEHARGPHALYFHNITPPDFFIPGSAAEQNSAAGWHQLRQHANRFDLFLGVSWFNLKCIAPHITNAKPMLAIHPVFDADAFKNLPFDSRLLADLTHNQPANWLFVGRIARNKRQDALMVLFDRFARSTDRVVHLWLVGNDQQDPVYRQELERLRLTLPYGHRIHFTGKVTEPELMAYYRAASLFVCASEHEGFCMPIAQAMAMGIPVVARAAAAVPETMGGSGLLIRRWVFSEMRDSLQAATFSDPFRQQIIDGQYRNLARFSTAEATLRLQAAVDYLLEGQTHPLLVAADQLAGVRTYGEPAA